MPTNILVWNIERFSLPKIGDANQGYQVRSIDGMRLSLRPDNVWRRAYILDNVRQWDPALFVVIELQSDQGQTGDPVSGNGMQACLYLLGLLRAQHPLWCLVPPLKLVPKLQISALGIEKEKQYTEAAAVYFRSDRLKFLGPCVRDSDYPSEWQGVLPDNQRRFMGQCRFFNGANELLFPNDSDRRPFFTKFQEVDAPGRLLSLAAVHFTPMGNGDSQMQAIFKLTQYFSQYVMDAKEIILIAGDYNLDCIASPPNHRTLQAFLSLRECGFWPICNRMNACGTLLKPTNVAEPTSYLTELGLDQVFAKRGDGLKPEDASLRVVDRVTSPEFSSLLLNPLAVINSIADDAERNRVFRSYPNFGCQRATSDHLALAISI